MVDDTELKLTPKEWELLAFLVHRPGRVFTREILLEQVWGYNYLGDRKTVDVHIRWLREKLGRFGKLGFAIVTVRGAGYRIDPMPEETEATAAEHGLGEINVIAGALAKGEGSLGRLLRDDDAYRRLVTLSSRGERASSTGSFISFWSRSTVNCTFLPTSYCRIKVESSSSCSAPEAVNFSSSTATMKSPAWMPRDVPVASVPPRVWAMTAK